MSEYGRLYDNNLKLVEEVFEVAKRRNLVFATMESCSGGNLADTITSVEGSSSRFRFGSVTYNTFAKVVMGVESRLIDEHTVYSPQVALDMAKAAAKNSLCLKSFGEEDASYFGIGVTGQLGRLDPGNSGGEVGRVDIGFYCNDRGVSETYPLTVDPAPRHFQKAHITKATLEKVLDIL